MSIIYSLIARIQQDKNPIILTSYDTASGNYPQIIIGFLKQMGNQNIQKTYIYNTELNFHVIKDADYVYVAMADSSFNRKGAFLFLNQLKEKFITKFGMERIKIAVAYSFSAQFQPLYRNLVIYYNTHPQMDKKTQLSNQLGQLKENLSDNIQKLLQRHSKLTILVNRTQHLDDFATKVKGNATRMRNQAFWRNNKCKIFIGGAVLVVILSIIVIL